MIIAVIIAPKERLERGKLCFSAVKTWETGEILFSLLRRRMCFSSSISLKVRGQNSWRGTCCWAAPKQWLSLFQVRTRLVFFFFFLFFSRPLSGFFSLSPPFLCVFSRPFMCPEVCNFPTSRLLRDSRGSKALSYSRSRCALGLLREY